MLRIGFGTDTHVLDTGDGLRLGGLTIPSGYRIVAHSDGDVLIHALIDALLGAACLGDIGDHFPERDTPKGIDSVLLLEKTLGLTDAAGMRLINVDCVIDLEAVKLWPWKKKIAANLARLTRLPERRVNVKAKTAEKLGPVGECRAVAAQVAVLAEMVD